MLFQRNKLKLPKLRQKFHVNWYLEQFELKIYVTICTSQSNKAILKNVQNVRIHTLLACIFSWRPQKLLIFFVNRNSKKTDFGKLCCLFICFPFVKLKPYGNRVMSLGSLSFCLTMITGTCNFVE
jgi:hypothetical protein